jgi:hypothetical protein
MQQPCGCTRAGRTEKRPLKVSAEQSFGADFGASERVICFPAAYAWCWLWPALRLPLPAVSATKGVAREAPQAGNLQALLQQFFRQDGYVACQAGRDQLRAQVSFSSSLHLSDCQSGRIRSDARVSGPIRRFTRGARVIVDARLSAMLQRHGFEEISSELKGE